MPVYNRGKSTGIKEIDRLFPIAQQQSIRQDIYAAGVVRLPVLIKVLDYKTCAISSGCKTATMSVLPIENRTISP